MGSENGLNWDDVDFCCVEFVGEGDGCGVETSVQQAGNQCVDVARLWDGTEPAPLPGWDGDGREAW